MLQVADFEVMRIAFYFGSENVKKCLDVKENTDIERMLKIFVHVAEAYIVKIHSVSPQDQKWSSSQQ